MTFRLPDANEPGGNEARIPRLAIGWTGNATSAACWKMKVGWALHSWRPLEAPWAVQAAVDLRLILLHKAALLVKSGEFWQRWRLHSHPATHYELAKSTEAIITYFLSSYQQIYSRLISIQMGFFHRHWRLRNVWWLFLADSSRCSKAQDSCKSEMETLLAKPHHRFAVLASELVAVLPCCDERLERFSDACDLQSQVRHLCGHFVCLERQRLMGSLYITKYSCFWKVSSPKLYGNQIKGDWLSDLRGWRRRR